MHLGMGLLPDDRKAEGIVADLSVRENIILAIQAKQGILKKIPMANSVRLQTSILIFSRSMCKPRDFDQTAFPVETSRRLSLQDGLQQTRIS